MEITKEDLLKIYQGLKYVDNLESDVNKKLALYAIPKNLELLQSEWDRLQKINPTKNNEVWQQERDVIIKEYANKDEKGNIIIKDNGDADVPEDKIQEVMDKIKPIDEKYSKEASELEKEWVETIKEDIEFDFYMIKESWLPEKMNNKALKFLQPIIELED